MEDNPGQGFGFEVLRRYAAVKEQVTSEREKHVATRYRDMISGHASTFATPSRKKRVPPSSSGRERTSFYSPQFNKYMSPPMRNENVHFESEATTSMEGHESLISEDLRNKTRNRLLDESQKQWQGNDKLVYYENSFERESYTYMKEQVQKQAMELEKGEVQMEEMARKISSLERGLEEAKRRESQSSERFRTIAIEISKTVDLVQQLQVHIFPKFSNAENVSSTFDISENEISTTRSEQYAHSELDRLYRSLVMLRMIVDAKVETMQTLRNQLKAEADEANFFLREERSGAAEAREALAKFEATTFVEREELRKDVNALKHMYNDELRKCRERLEVAESTASSSEARLAGTESQIARLKEILDTEKTRRETLERQLMAEQQAHHDSVVSERMLQQRCAGLSAEIQAYKEFFDQQDQCKSTPNRDKSVDQHVNLVEETAALAANFVQ